MRSLGRWARELLEASLIAIVFALLLRTFVLQVYRVPSSSMEPGLLAGDFVLVNKLVLRRPSRWAVNPWLPQRPVARGDVLVFPHPTAPSRLLVKRCVGLGDDHIHVRDKVLYLDRERVAEPYVVHRDERVYPGSTFLPREFRSRDQFGPIAVAGDELFCLGDNRDRSLDSRHWGTVESVRVVGAAVLGFRRGRAMSDDGDALPPEGGREPGRAEEVGTSRSEGPRLFRVR